ncbi:MAG: mechanosensitive ion channel family protein [Anaerolineales bacterium]
MFLGLTGEQWLDIVISLLIVIAAAAIVRILLGYLLDRILQRLLGERGKAISRTLLKPVRASLNILAVLVALNLTILRLDIPYVVERSDSIKDIFFVLYLLTGFILILRLAGSLTAWYAKEVAPKTDSKLDDQLVPFGRRVVYILMTIIMLIILLSHFDVDVSGLVATLGIASLAIALAAQAALADTIAGFVIMLDRPFRIGDRIEIQDLDTWGDVIDIGLRSSRVRTRDNRMVIVPNSVMSKSLLVNYSYPDTTYRIQIELPISYGTKVDLAKETLISAVQQVEGVEPERPVEALFLHFGDSGMIFRVRWWLDSYVDTRRMFDQVNTAIIRALDEANIEVPNPVRDLNHKIGDTEVRKLVTAFREVG